ncbi:MAG: acyltransferase [Chitinophagaceae bacterium]|nr:acyltransferase [Chitinophagaceae bacterium]
MSNDDPVQSPVVLKYNPQIDGLRFCAVLFVVCYHWIPSIAHLEISSFFGGVINFFFVLSSFLITRLLFSAKEKGVGLGVSKFKVMLVFILRRTIRIFPAYYLFLLLLLLLPTIGNEVRENAGMYFSYLANYHIYQGHDFPMVTPHIWTLAVEEQFYLVWPLLILFIPHRHLLKTLVGIIISSVVLRAITFNPAAGVPQAILTQYCVDAFAVGALLAYKYTAPDNEKKAINKYLNILLYIGIPLGIIIILTRSYYFSFVFNRLLFALISVKVLEGAVAGYKSYLGRFLQNNVVLYLGRISYGIYLYHLLVPVVFWKLYDMAYAYIKTSHPSFYASHLKAISNVENFLVLQGVGFVIYALLVVGIASLSWKFVEKPLNKLKVAYNFKPGKAALSPANPVQNT